MAQIFHFILEKSSERPLTTYGYLPMSLTRPKGKARKSLLEPALEISAIESSEYFASLALGLRWYSYDDLKVISDLRRATTVVGHLPIPLLVLPAADAADIKQAA